MSHLILGSRWCAAWDGLWWALLMVYVPHFHGKRMWVLDQLSECLFFSHIPCLNSKLSFPAPGRSEKSWRGSPVLLAGESPEYNESDTISLLSHSIIWASCQTRWRRTHWASWACGRMGLAAALCCPAGIEGWYSGMTLRVWMLMKFFCILACNNLAAYQFCRRRINSFFQPLSSIKLTFFFLLSI